MNNNSMKHIEIINLSNALAKVKNVNGFEAKIRILKNKKALEKEVAVLQEAEKQLFEMRAEHDKQINDAYKEFSGGKTKMENNQEVFDVPVEKMSELRAKINSINTDNKDLLDNLTKKVNEFRKHLTENESDFKPIFIPLSLIEKYDSTLSQEELECISPLIDFEN